MFARAERKAEESELEQADLSEATRALFSAVEHNDIKGALAHINAGADIHAILYPDSTFSTPLSMAVFCLHFDMVKFLLEQGANPNLMPEGGSSLVECLFVRITSIELNAQNGYPEKRPATLGHFKLPFRVKATITEDVIDAAQRILELLACYQLNPKIQWSEDFKKGKEELCEAYSYLILGLAKKQAFVLARKTAVTEPSLRDSVVTTLIRAELSVRTLWNKAENDGMMRLFYFVNSVSECEVALAKEATEVQQAREELRRQYQDKLSTIPDMPHVPKEVARLIIEYIEPDLSQWIAKKRLEQNKSVRFWKPIDPRVQQALIEQKAQDIVDHLKQRKAEKEAKEQPADQRRPN